MAGGGRRTEALGLIRRIKQHEIDQIAAVLGGIRAQQAEITTELETLKHRVETEAHISSPEAAPFLAAFLAQIEKRRTALFARKRELDDEARSYEIQLLDLFAEAKANDSLLDMLEEERRQAAGRAEIAEMEEVARNMFLARRTPK